MLYDMKELRALAAMPLGRAMIVRRVQWKLAPIMRVSAAAYRRSLARRVRVIAVTGSFGKTTTATAAAVALGLPVPETLASNGLWGAPVAMLSVRRQHPRAVIEVGIDRPGQMSRQSRMLQPDVVVITAVGSEHQDGLGSLETTQREKARLLEHLRRPGLAVLNGDDPRVRAMAGWTDARAVTYGLTAGMDVQASDVRLDWPHGTRFTLHAHGATREMRLKGLGRAMIAPALAAVAVATNEGRSLDDAVAALEELMPLPGRLQLVELADGIRMIRDDQKVSVETIHAAFDVLAEIPGRRMLVLGESPKWTDSLDPAYRELGKRMAEILDAVVFVGANNERLAAYASEAGMPKDALHRVEPGVHTIVAALRELMRPGDTILLKGYIYQRLERVALALQGQTIGCGLVHCELPCPWGCATCPMLATGWNQRRVLR